MVEVKDEKDKRIDDLIKQFEKMKKERDNAMANLARINNAAAMLETAMIKVRDFCSARAGYGQLFVEVRDALNRYVNSRDKQIK